MVLLRPFIRRAYRSTVLYLIASLVLCVNPCTVLAQNGGTSETTPDKADNTDTDDLRSIIENLKTFDDIDDMLELEDAGDGLWVATYKEAENFERLTIEIGLITDEFNRSVVWIRSLLAGFDTELTTLQLRDMLELNYDLNLAKVVIDDGDILTMAEAELRTLDSLGLLRIVYAVADAADRVTVVLDPALNRAEALSRSEHDEESSIELLNGNFVVRYNRSDWIERPEGAEANVDIDMVYQHSSSEVFVAVAANRMQIPIETLPDLALDDIRSVFPDAEMTNRGFRTVNGLESVYWEHTLTTSGVKFSYVSHAYSNSNGTLRIIGWTTPNLIEVHRSTIESFVAGLEVIMP
ncbi:MAG: YbjN domain-containing protein [Gemmatimonadetes bacterium]|nr:YbjN domain-containing protein [Gemmatimonadota bacterium]MYG16606.1 YbjN domain-containing protein [Gemmatimonadota bacterium]MYH18487.1 YbjN domain-containing protein [Gemmatimonadota bacterium]